MKDKTDEEITRATNVIKLKAQVYDLVMKKNKLQQDISLIDNQIDALNEEILKASNNDTNING